MHAQYFPTFLTKELTWVVQTNVNWCVTLPGTWEYIHHGTTFEFFLQLLNMWLSFLRQLSEAGGLWPGRW